ncbi:MAG: hypothetical protein KGR26_00050 [Cyanobacteria bacterium REEB65]|nr:hypothetical protein [Cyanobacteria bacterium REEB65]
MDFRDADRLRVLLYEHAVPGNIRVVPLGESLSLVSGEKPGLLKHARLTRLGQDRWAISLPRHDGKWEKTAFVGRMEEMVAIITRALPPFQEPR